MADTDLPEISSLAHASKTELLAIWAKVHGQPPAFRTSRELLMMAIGWQLQARRHGGLSPSVRRRLEALAKLYERKGPEAEPDPSLSLRPGTVLLKEWRGQRHAVTVVAAHNSVWPVNVGVFPPAALA